MSNAEQSLDSSPAWAKALSLLWLVLTMVVVILLVAKAWIDVDNGWDTWTYHVPFAGRLWGLVPESLYHFDATIQQRWEGFALLGEWLQGALWMLTGHLEATNYVALLSLFAFCVTLFRRFSVPLTLSLPALLAVPLIHFHAATSYVDLPAALWFSLAMVLLADMLLRPERQTRSAFLFALLSGALAANIKTLYAPLFAISLLLWAVVFFQTSLRGLSKRWVAACLPVALCLTLFVPIKNTLLWGNPLHGVEAKIGEWVLSEGENFSRDVPTAHVSTPGPLRWVISVLEVQNPPFSWSSGQTANIPPDVVKARRAQLKTEADIDALQKATPWYRFGGFFREYVLLNLLVFVVLLREYRKQGRDVETRFALGVLGLLTVLAAFSPMSFHLRYSLYWMVSLISLNLILLCRLPIMPRTRTLAHGVVWAVFVLVFWTTGMRQIIPAKYTFALHRQRIQALVHWKAPTKADAFCYTGFPYTALFTAPLQDNAARVPQYVLYDYGPARILSGPLGGKKLPAPCR